MRESSVPKSLTGAGDGTFKPKVDYGTAKTPNSIAIGDFNADGILDLAVACRTADRISIFLGRGSGGQGDGTFQSRPTCTTGSDPRQVVAADFNTDGILDLAVVNYLDDSFSILLGNGSNGRGDGTFQARVDYPTGSMPMSITTGDFNADGILDLAVVSVFPDRINIHLGNGSNGRGNGTFQTGVDYTTGSDPRFVTTGDFDADGILDLAVANYNSGSVGILLGGGSGGRGDGTFQIEVGYPVGPDPCSLTIGDFNADGILDLAVGNTRTSYGVSVLLGEGYDGRGDGTFTTRVNYPTGTNPQFVTTGDFDVDGILDLAVTNWGSDSVSILLGSGICVSP